MFFKNYKIIKSCNDRGNVETNIFRFSLFNIDIIIFSVRLAYHIFVSIYLGSGDLGRKK